MAPNVSAPDSKPRSHLRSIFIGPQGIRSGWRLLLFLVILITAEVLPARILRYVLPQLHTWAISQPKAVINPGFQIFGESWETFFLLLALFIMSRIERISFSSYGMPLRSAFGRKFWLGLAVGLGAVSLQVGLIGLAGGYTLGKPILGVGGAFGYGLVWAIVFLMVGISEEILFRGYAQTTLASGIGFWPAAVLVSLGFAAYHLGSPNEKWPGILMVFCYGVFATYTLRVFGDLWFIIGLHAAWDWAHVFLFSVPIAGNSGRGHLLNSSLHGPPWLTGGSVGPDGSVFAFVVLIALLALTYRAFGGTYRHTS